MMGSSAQVVMGVIKATSIISAFAIIAVAVVKERPAKRHPFVLNRTYHCASAALAGLLLLAFAGVAARSLTRFAGALCARLRWSRRRTIALASAYTRAAAVLTMLLTWLIDAAVRASDAAIFCRPPAAVLACESVHWSAWNLLLLVSCIDAHNIVLRPQAGRRDGQVRDAPVWVHWPKTIIWAVNQGVHAAPGDSFVGVHLQPDT